MNRVSLVLLVGAPIIAACGTTTPTVQPQLNLDRPVDIAFACYGALRTATGHEPPAIPSDPIRVTAQPARSCELRSQLPPATRAGQDGDPATVGPLPEPPAWFGFILQSTTGTVVVSRWAVKPSSAFLGGDNFSAGDVAVLDGDRLTPGKSTVVVGDRPVGIVTDRAGCYAVTANAGSCDLSTLEINSVADNDPTTPVKLARVPVTTPMGKPILAQPAALVVEPSTTEIGRACPATASGLVYVAYPGCHMVAGIDAATGKIASAVKFDVLDKLDEPTVLSGADLETLATSCPAECRTAGAPTAGKRPTSVALTGAYGAPKRLAIGAEDSNKLTVVDLDPVTSLPVAAAPLQIALFENRTGKLGVSAVALSPVVGLGGKGGVNNDADHLDGSGQYVYAVASDGTVRVADVLDAKHECETQPDMRFLRGVSDVKLLQCLPVGAAPAGTARRPGARGPGIELPTDGVPTSVAFVRGEPRIIPNTDEKTKLEKPEVVDPASQREAVLRLRGLFAVIASASGLTYVANVDDDGNGDDVDDTTNKVRAPYSSDVFDPMHQQRTAPVLLIAHQLRDSVSKRGSDTTVEWADVSNPAPDPLPTPPTNLGKPACIDSVGLGLGGPRVSALPSRITAGGAIDGNRTATTDKTSLLPTLRQLACTSFDSGPTDAKPYDGILISELGLAASPAERDVAFPDLRSLAADETWSLTWQGTLSLDTSSVSRDGPLVRTGQLAVDYGMRLTDPTRPFCDMGVEPYDIVELRGCNPSSGDADCPANYTCFKHPDARYTDPDTKVSPGTCMLKTEAQQFANACRDFLISRRTYSVLRPAPGQLVDSAQEGQLYLTPRKHVLRTTPVDGCVADNDDQQCHDLADLEASSGLDVQPKDARKTPRAPGQEPWQCQLDETRAPVNSDPARNKRCVRTCGVPGPGQDRDADCGDVGLICVGASPGVRGVCMESIVPPQACVNAPQRFAVRASDAFTVIGTTTGYVHPLAVNTGKALDPTAEATSCVRPDLATHPELRTQIGRVPLKAPACVAGADPITGEVTPGSGVFEPNPCSLTVDHAEVVSKYADAVCTPPAGKSLVTRSAPAIRFRNRGMRWTVVDPWVTPDLNCVGDRAGPAAKVPLAFQGYQLTFRQAAGYTPLSIGSINPAFPIKVVPGPTNSIWVMDAGDALSSTSVSTRGKVFRIESSALNVVNTLF